MAFKLDALTDKVPSALKYAIAIALVWIVLGMTMCSCCSYTLGDMIRLAFHAVYNLLTGSDEVSIEITDIRKKTCECVSPWYSPCVIWGSKSAKEGGCAKDVKKENDTLNNGVDAAALGSQGAKEAFGCGCAATNVDVGAGGAAYVRDNVILPNRCGNRK